MFPALIISKYLHFIYLFDTTHQPQSGLLALLPKIDSNPFLSLNIDWNGHIFSLLFCYHCLMAKRDFDFWTVFEFYFQIYRQIITLGSKIYTGMIMHAILSKLNSLLLRDGKWRAILVADFLSEIERIVFVEWRPFMKSFWFFGNLVIN